MTIRRLMLVADTERGPVPLKATAVRATRFQAEFEDRA